MIYFTSLNEDNYILDRDNIILSNIDLLSEVTLMFINESNSNKSILTKLKDFVNKIIEKLKAWFKNLFSKKTKCDVSNINDIEKQYYDSEKPSSKFSEDEKMNMYKNTMEKYEIASILTVPVLSSVTSIYTVNSMDLFDDITIDKRKEELKRELNHAIVKGGLTRIDDISNIYTIQAKLMSPFMPTNPKNDFKKISDIIKKYNNDIQSIYKAIDNDIKDIEKTYNDYIKKLEKKREMYYAEPKYQYKINLSLKLMSLDTKTFIEYYNRIIAIYKQEINNLYVLQNKIIKTSQYFGLEYK